MNANVNQRTVDLVVFICANLFNLFIFFIMLSRPFGLERLERVVGILNLLLVIPLTIAVILNFNAGNWAAPCLKESSSSNCCWITFCRSLSEKHACSGHI